jgi:hypothetical protein
MDDGDDAMKSSMSVEVHDTRRINGEVLGRATR